MEHRPRLGSPLCCTHGGHGKGQKIATVFYPVVPVLCGFMEHPDSTPDLKERELKVLLCPLLAVDQPCCSLETQKGHRPGHGRLDLPLRQELQESWSREPGRWRLWPSEALTWSRIHPWRGKQTEQAPSWQQDSILGWTVDFELYAQYLWKQHTNWKTRPSEWKSPRACT